MRYTFTYYYYLDGIKYANIAIKIDKFFECNPPCKECLIQNMCIEEIEYHLQIKICKKLKNYISKSNKYKCFNTGGNGEIRKEIK